MVSPELWCPRNSSDGIRYGVPGTLGMVSPELCPRNSGTRVNSSWFQQGMMTVARPRTAFEVMVGPHGGIEPRMERWKELRNLGWFNHGRALNYTEEDGRKIDPREGPDGRLRFETQGECLSADVAEGRR